MGDQIYIYILFNDYHLKIFICGNFLDLKIPGFNFSVLFNSLEFFLQIIYFLFDIEDYF